MESKIEQSYRGRKICDSKEPGYCGSCSYEIHRDQMKDPTSWVHSSVDEWLEAARIGRVPTKENKEIPRLRAENKQLREKVKDLLYCLARIHDLASQIKTGVE